jgi:hypothetical protein
VENIPSKPVPPRLALRVPAVDANVTARPEIGFPVLSAVATKSCQAPLLVPPSTGVPNRTSASPAAAYVVTVAVPDLVESCVEVALIVAVPADPGVKTPALLMLPTLEGLTDQLTELLKLPVPLTVAAQLAV